MLYKVINPLSIKKPIYDKNNGYKITGYEEVQNSAVINDLIDSVNYTISVDSDIIVHESHATILVKKYPFLLLEVYIAPIEEKEAEKVDNKPIKERKTK